MLGRARNQHTLFRALCLNELNTKYKSSPFEVYITSYIYPLIISPLSQSLRDHGGGFLVGSSRIYFPRLRRSRRLLALWFGGGFLGVLSEARGVGLLGLRLLLEARGVGLLLDAQGIGQLVASCSSCIFSP